MPALKNSISPNGGWSNVLVFGSTDEAEAAKTRLSADEITFDALIEERGLSLADVDLGDVSKPELDAAGEAVFSAEVGDVVGPIDTAIGPALFRVNGVLQAQETSYEDALPRAARRTGRRPRTPGD